MSQLSEPGIERVRAVTERHVGRDAVPGLVWAVAAGTEVHVGAAGSMGTDDSRPMARDTIFRISSMTKPVTAVATMILVEECLLRIDDPVDDLLPELADRRVLRTLDAEVDDTVPAHRPITVRDLLTFRSGYGYVFAEGSLPILGLIDEVGLSPGPPLPAGTDGPDEWIARFTGLPLAHQPGEVWMYHVGADLLGVLLARACGTTLGEVLRTKVFEPLGLHDTGFSVPAADHERLPAEYVPDGEHGLTVFDPAGGASAWAAPPAFEGGGAGLVSTVDDYLAFASMLARGGATSGGERLLAPATFAAMVTDQLTPEQKARTPELVPGYWDGFGWGLGIGVCNRRVDLETRPGRLGWDGGLGTAFTADPGSGLVTLLMTQRLWESPAPPPVVRDFRTAAHAALTD